MVGCEGRGRGAAAVLVGELEGAAAVVVGEPADATAVDGEVDVLAAPAAVEAAGADVGPDWPVHAARATHAPSAVMRRGRPFMVRR